MSKAADKNSEITKSKRSRIATVVNRLIRVVVLISGVLCLVGCYNFIQQYIRYNQRDQTTTAEVTNRTTSTDKYDYKTCAISYHFSVDDNQYDSATAWNSYYCSAKKGSKIKIRYQADYPYNNSYGDSKSHEHKLLGLAIGTGLAGLLLITLYLAGFMANRRNTVSTSKAVDNANIERHKFIKQFATPLGKALIIIGIIVIILGLVQGWRYIEGRQRTADISGEVTDLYHVKQTYHTGQPVIDVCRIDYRIMVDGRHYTNDMGYKGRATTAKCDLKPGDKVQIRFDQRHPANNAYSDDDITSGYYNDSISRTRAARKKQNKNFLAIELTGIMLIVAGIVARHQAERLNEDEEEEIEITDNDRDSDLQQSKASAKILRKEQTIEKKSHSVKVKTQSKLKHKRGKKK